MFVMAAILAAGMGLVVLLIAMDRTRFLIRFDLKQWRYAYYMRSLPNFLQALHDNHFTSPWPPHHDAVSAAYFCYRASSLLKKHPAHLRRAFLRQHIALFGLLEVLKPYLRDFILNEQQKIAGDRILTMEDTIERDRLITFLEQIRGERNQFFKTLTDIDRANLIAMVDRRIIPTLRAAHAIFQEHGFVLLPELTQLRRWEEMTGTELVQELPSLSGRKSRRSYSTSY
jgi:hypothetical protein